MLPTGPDREVTRVLIPWGPTLRLGFADIDNQHRRLVDLINTLDDGMRAGRGQEIVGPVLDELIHYTVHHFGFEEELMDAYQISSADSQRTAIGPNTTRSSPRCRSSGPSRTPVGSSWGI
jgi:hypothetical protein